MLARFERLMEQAVEGSLRRVFPTQLQPVQLAKAAARAMEQAQVIGLRGPEVPNRYELRLSPTDLERFGAYSTALVEEVARYLEDYAHERGLHPVASPRVELIEDSSVRAGSVRAQARFADLAPAVRQEVEAAVEGTRQLRLGELAAARSQGVSTPGRDGALLLTDQAGLRFALEPQVGIVRLGRAMDNDVVLSSQRVSRYHAQLRWVDSCWLVYDLNSTNGSWVDEQRVAGSAPRAIAAGSTLRLGDHELVARADG
jgi:FHA domain-containing protein